MNAATPATWPVSPTRFMIPGPVGALECIALSPSERPTRIAVVCHPHSLHGGSMDNKVVVMLERALRELGVASVRFNFRSVGASQGSYDEGIGEGEDLAAVVALARGWSPAAELILAGFSFGTFVSARMADPLAANLLISVAPAVTRFDFTGLGRPQCRWIVLQGETDEVVDPVQVFAYLAHLQPPIELLRFADTGHFFHGKLVQLRERLVAVLRGDPDPGVHPQAQA